jgi:hypothetical protein
MCNNIESCGHEGHGEYNEGSIRKTTLCLQTRDDGNFHSPRDCS